MSEEALAKLEETAVALKSAVRDGTLPQDVYYKSVVLLAHDYVALGKIQEGVSLLNSVPVEYFLNTQAKQATEDPAYGAIATALSDMLLAAGVVDAPLAGNILLIPTQKQAKA